VWAVVEVRTTTRLPQVLLIRSSDRECDTMPDAGASRFGTAERHSLHDHGGTRAQRGIPLRAGAGWAARRDDHGSHDRHAGHTPEMFRDRAVAYSHVPVVPTHPDLLGYDAPIRSGLICPC
jgi:hypothetical protein